MNFRIINNIYYIFINVYRENKKKKIIAQRQNTT